MNKRTQNLRYLAMIVFVCLTNIAKAQVTDELKAEQLDNRFKRLSDISYSSSSLYIKNSTLKSGGISSLYRKIKEFNDNKKYSSLLTNLHANELLIKKNIDNEAIYYFLNILLDHNDWFLASRIYEYIYKEGDKSLISNVKYIFAKYHYNRSEWEKTLGLLFGINSDLGINEGHYALIMTGVVLQKLKKHREALKYYDQVPNTSKYYNYAQLNKATVYIRQGWWSDAHRIINNLLTINSNKTNNKDDFNNRLYLVLGYSFLQQEYFRESRDSFRNIQKNSRYSDRALLGISLAAANQGDNIGALNILNILQEDKIKSLSTEESYLLLPYIYERLGQHKTASASYSIALSYYQKRINEINAVLNSIKNNPDKLRPETDSTLVFNGKKIPVSNSREIAHIKNVRELNILKGIKKEKKTQDAIQALIKEYDIYASQLATKILRKTLDNLKSYLNQSQYGVARLYDNSNPE